MIAGHLSLAVMRIRPTSDPDSSNEDRPSLYPRPNPNEQNKAANLLIIHWIIFNTEGDE
jgi:hypothetical protein